MWGRKRGCWQPAPSPAACASATLLRTIHNKWKAQGAAPHSLHTWGAVPRRGAKDDGRHLARLPRNTAVAEADQAQPDTQLRLRGQAAPADGQLNRLQQPLLLLRGHHKAAARQCDVVHCLLVCHRACSGQWVAGQQPGPAARQQKGGEGKLGGEG